MRSSRSRPAPRYRPWRQRIAFIPDGDLFQGVRDGKAAIVTDEIEQFVETGVVLKSGIVASRLHGPQATMPWQGTTLQIVGETLCASELARVCKPGGRIGLANWTPESFIGQLFKTIGKYTPPPPGVKSPALWDTKAALETMFGETARAIHTATREFTFRYRSPARWTPGSRRPSPRK